MRTLKNLAVTSVAVCSALSWFFHFVGIGALIGALLCAYLWRQELWVWLHETWRRLWAEVGRSP